MLPYKAMWVPGIKVIRLGSSRPLLQAAMLQILASCLIVTNTGVAGAIVGVGNRSAVGNAGSPSSTNLVKEI